MALLALVAAAESVVAAKDFHPSPKNHHGLVLSYFLKFSEKQWQNVQMAL